MTNYFEFYNLPESFLADEKAVKAKYYELSRAYHPDFFANDTPEKQQEILQLSTVNTNAYRTLSNPDLRMQYILKEHGILEEGGKNDLPPDFLMEMMDINEELMELEFDFDAAKLHEIGENVAGLTATLDADILPTLQRFPDLHGVTKNAALEEVKTYYLKKKYLLRIKETLSKFAARS
ncbi:Fe-S protein assembly co-chaperone HscB [Pontibacter qinzhouensis]|uniref:Fe-S protein assembly co-chaperone HscB n=1 Tax=Pontibacter qinzhouensis TaxID=2603253 RepID=A0A5C8JMG0_9BACT|nr:Fe-S protein assembly co-chaperone HscB [Pontibacter qinzhouensis]TXK37897.1 Fe-S protein assembly co-chaperone HscB [Pontibacter qinzhouensis]